MVVLLLLLTTLADLIPCQNQLPCQHGATCSNTGAGTYQCSCVPGYYGTNCENEINECVNVYKVTVCILTTPTAGDTLSTQAAAPSCIAPAVNTQHPPQQATELCDELQSPIYTFAISIAADY